MGNLYFNKNRDVFLQGMRDGIPIGLGYFAVSFSLGIVAKSIGITPLQGFFVSLFCRASAGEYAGYTMIGALATYLETFLVCFIANARYLLMSCATSQRVKEDLPFIHRIGISLGLTDEIFAISIAREGYLNPYYTYGALVVAAPCWASGTMCGIIAGNILPLRVVSALSVALYGMFLAVIIPPIRKEKVIGIIVIVSFIFSYIFDRVTIFSNISSGTKTIILTVVISSVVAVIFPRKDDPDEKIKDCEGDMT